MGKLLIVIGIIFILVGLIIHFTDKLDFFGKLPGDIVIRNENTTFYFPLVSCLIISLFITLIWMIIKKL